MVLEGGQDLVADPFIERHPASARRSPIDHARTEDRVCFSGHKGREQLRQFLRRVLPVAMNERHDIEPIVDGVAISEFLVPAVTLVLRRAQNGDFKGGLLALESYAISERRVL